MLQVFEAHNIRYFFYAGGNDSQDTADKISPLRRLALRDRYPEDHRQRPGHLTTPRLLIRDQIHRDYGQGNAADNAAMGQHDLVQIVEVMAAVPVDRRCRARQAP